MSAIGASHAGGEHGEFDVDAASASTFSSF